MQDNAYQRPATGAAAPAAILHRHFVRKQSLELKAPPPGGPPPAGRPPPANAPPQLGYGVDIQNRSLGADEVELELKLRLEGRANDQLLFLFEAAYAGIFQLRHVAREALQRILLIDAPQALFPFVQRLAQASLREAGFGTLAVEQVNFTELYRARTGSVPPPVAGFELIIPDAASVREIFPTHLYSAPLGADLHGALEAACLALAQDDEAGRAWCKANAYRGYTSYATVRDLIARAPVFAELVSHLDRHVADFAAKAEFDMTGRRLVLDGIWANVMEEGSLHASHIHPHSAVSGTYYVTTPKSAAAICFEDPRTPLMMSAPPRAPTAQPDNRAFVSVSPQAGSLLLWESWLRHGVEMQGGGAPRISISFNYRIEIAA